jgi:hypothetical protein
MWSSVRTSLALEHTTFVHLSRRQVSPSTRVASNQPSSTIMFLDPVRTRQAIVMIDPCTLARWWTFPCTHRHHSPRPPDAETALAERPRAMHSPTKLSSQLMWRLHSAVCDTNRRGSSFLCRKVLPNSPPLSVAVSVFFYLEGKKKCSESPSLDRSCVLKSAPSPDLGFECDLQSLHYVGALNHCSLNLIDLIVLHPSLLSSAGKTYLQET